MPLERARETDPPASSPEPSARTAVRGDGRHRRALGASPEKGPRHEDPACPHPGGRPHKRWKIRVVRIDARKYPPYARDPDHPFARMAAEARIEEFDSFFARTQARRKTVRPSSGALSAAA